MKKFNKDIFDESNIDYLNKRPLKTQIGNSIFKK